MRTGVRRPLVLLTALLALVLAGCSDDGDGSGGDGGSEGNASGDEFEDGPAPSAVGSGWDGNAVRVDEITREGSRIDLTLTLANVAETHFDDSDLRLLTDTGIELPRAPEQERTLPTRSRTTVEVSARDLPEEPGRLTLDVAGTSVDVPVPDDGQTLKWRPAPRRQTGFTDGLVRDDSVLTLMPYTFRTQGLISEVTFLAINQSTLEPDLCWHRNITDCFLQDGSGRTYPMLGPAYEFPSRGQVRGTLRFLGEIPPDVEELTLVMEGAGGSVVSPDAHFEYPFSVPSAEESPARAVAQNTLPEPFDVGETVGEGTIEVELGEMSFAEDRIQLEATATVSEGNGLINYSGDALIRDPSGFEHPLRGPEENSSLEFEEGRSVDVTLVFLTRVSPDADELEIVFSNGSDRTYGTTVELPDGEGAGDTAEDASEGTSGSGADDEPTSEDDQ